MFKKDKDSKEFFEVFKKPKDLYNVKYRRGVPGAEQKNPSVIPPPTPKKNKVSVDEEKREAETEQEQLHWIKDTKTGETFKSRAQKYRKLLLNELTLKHETLILCALGAVFLAFACFFTGYKFGYNKALNPEISQGSNREKKSDGKVKAVPPGVELEAVDLTAIPRTQTNEELQNIKWTLQIISYSDTKNNKKKAANLARAIKNMTHYHTFVAKRGNELVVCVGKFDSRNGDEVKKCLAKISNLEYEGKKQFSTSYPIQIK
ncbi:MAG: hypothetical protein D8M57_08830 [Candidatus Scalindua sp. AMX11]|nr:MAG: hypothetical protein DWQ00_10030 [Candidatus Scalindua sp.]NOG84501.1 hypothetical protein [Planctomycetota bacterium]RZV80491.1 MAG: hypothetical protein EX341_10595 [Candidatus Scalindua sp. SCAELEC01]TDE65288.1 MAG: hypothetical protein D8M57_08830 [Candidatus Scalindua sp. AMX11]GJQ58502.1 MAG: hypothetical protein SCALA701_13030 [Candidatus Scalindua sp.]